MKDGIKETMRYLLFAAVFGLGLGLCQAQAGERNLLSRVWFYNGKSYQGVKSSEYIAYDIALRNYLVDRIQKRFGVNLDPKEYSGFDLLEIESLFKCKKANEPYDLFLKEFPKQF